MTSHTLGLRTLIMSDSLFEYGFAAPDDTYNAIRDNDTPEEHRTRLLLDDMWLKYKPYADTDFRRQIQCDFDSRFWEMYLACTLIDNAIPISARGARANQGPDILVDLPGRRVWIEATAPTAGDQVNPDHVPWTPPGFVTAVPKDRILLRYRAAIEDKHSKYKEYMQNGIVAPTDAYVIAIDSCRIPNALANADWKNEPPYVLEVVFPIEKVWNVSSTKVVRQDFQFRDGIDRASGARVNTSVFLDPGYSGISGVLCAHVSSGYMPSRMGGNFILVHNPIASNRLPNGFLKVGREYTASQGEDGYVLRQTVWE